MTEYARKAPRRKRRRRAARRAAVLIIVLILLAAVFAVLSVTVLFNVASVSSSGDTRYSEEEIISAAGIEIGDNMMLMSSDKINRAVSERLPYIESVKLSRRLPDKLVLKVTECVPDSAYLCDGGYLLAEGTKALEVTDTIPDGIMLVNVGLESYTIGKEVSLPDGAALTVTKLLDSIDNVGLETVTQVDVANISDIAITYDNRIVLQLGTAESLDKKLSNAISIIETEEQKYGEKVEGYVNLRFLGEDSNQSYFTRKSISSQSSAPSE